MTQPAHTHLEKKVRRGFPHPTDLRSNDGQPTPRQGRDLGDKT